MAMDYGSGQSAGADVQDRAPDGTREAPYVGQGVIQWIGENQLEIRHGEIAGLMGGMTMIFRVDPEAMNDALEVGDEIIFSIETPQDQGDRIFKIEVLPGADIGYSAQDPGFEAR